ncbi:MAG: hypothetical protein UR28_C0029G0013 [Candidatus Peregrinibacteria bacterium GW2011_GWF2_33_10]|nr:MAG: hypothetical protein UR28_C0029G0013 [Candidatus Peregrinibacteria bacterium GW2011_GWF2_33_10]OGJ44765.1 MAG: hypothetical protein A2272_04545 [Candidatus Peregrinibacteria bacterium RIFOXYA12_FULL_33_12]OGJ51038.1 MAG: hypothetical protein A2307_05770 [Candidatus Peregrinibacteria bacterium RIFOXYB2_FULL_33_20]
MPDYLYIIIASSVSLLTILLALALIYLVFILRDVTKIVDQVDETVNKVQDCLLKPIALTNQLLQIIRSILESANKKVRNKKE